MGHWANRKRRPQVCPEVNSDEDLTAGKGRIYKDMNSGVFHNYIYCKINVKRKYDMIWTGSLKHTHTYNLINVTGIEARIFL